MQQYSRCSPERGPHCPAQHVPPQMRGATVRYECGRGHTLLADPRSGCDAGPPLPEATMQLITFELDRDFVELNQLLKITGLCDSGGAGKQLVASGVVRVDGMVELRKTCKIHAGQRVTIDDIGIDVVAPG